MRIVCIGSGYVGLVSGAMFADAGHNVVCVDVDASKVALLNAGHLPIYEPGLGEIVERNRAAGRLAFADDGRGAVAAADLILLAVGTPPQADGSADLTYLFSAARDVGASLQGFTTVAVKSSVPPGTTEEVERIIRDTNPAADFAVVSNPEFLREGVAIADFRRPDRIVVGASDERGREAMRLAYTLQIADGVPILFVTRRTAELVKYAANSFLAVKVAFINEIADLAEAIGADVEEVAHGIGLDHRIGPQFLRAGPGYGGSCLPKDTLALTTLAADLGAPLHVIEATMHSNADRRSRRMLRRVTDALGGVVKGKRIAVLGLAFKSDTDDLRESPAIDLIRGLEKLGAETRAYDPQAMDHARVQLRHTTMAKDAYSAADGADALVVMTDWPEFQTIDLRAMADRMRGHALLDMRNAIDQVAARNAGFAYRGIGRGTGAGVKGSAIAAGQSLRNVDRQRVYLVRAVVGASSGSVGAVQRASRPPNRPSR